MKLEGERWFKAPPETLWVILNDPDWIARHIPGCETLEVKGDDTYEAVLKIGIGPIKGTYAAKVQLTDKQRPVSYGIRVEGSGKPGFVKGTGTVHLAGHDGGTTLTYSGELQFGGMIARVGQRLIGTVAEQMTARFFEGLGSEAEG